MAEAYEQSGDSGDSSEPSIRSLVLNPRKRLFGKLALRRDARDHPDYDAFYAELLDYVARFPSADEQGGLKWRIQRALTIEPSDRRGEARAAEGKRTDERIYYAIGGSELDTILTGGKFKTPNELLYEKVHFLTRGVDQPNTADPTKTEWGHIMEPALAHYIGCCMGSEHVALEASVTHRSVKNFRYSPDGFFILRADETMPDGAVNDILIAALFEAKNPNGRRIKGEGIPDYYMAQVRSGMDAFGDFVTHGLFAEANFYIQELGRWGQPYYNPRLIGSFVGGSPNGKIGPERFKGLELLDACVIGFFPTAKMPADVYAEFKVRLASCYNAAHSVWDVGRGDPELFTWLMKMYKLGYFTSQHSGFMRANARTLRLALEDLRNEAARLELVMAVGLFNCDWYLHEGNTSYVEYCRTAIEFFAARVAEQVEAAGGLHPMFRGGAPPSVEDLSEDFARLSLSQFAQPKYETIAFDN